MKRKPYILVFSAGSAWVISDVKALAKVIDEGDMIYAFDGNVVFLRTALNVEELTERLRSGPIGDGQFFLADVSESGHAGNMAPKFWNYLRSADALSPAA